MSEIKRFEDLIAWQKARAVTGKVYQVTREGPFSRDFKLKDRTCHAAVSVMSNIAEGFVRNGAGAFGEYLSAARGACAQLRSHLYVARDTGYLTEEEFKELLAMMEEESKILGGLQASVARNRNARRAKAASE